MGNDVLQKANEQRDLAIAWAKSMACASIRLVQYCGNEFVNGIDVPPGDVGMHVHGLICEGFHVDWAEFDGQGYLRVWEGLDEAPEWFKVVKEVDLIEIPDLSDMG